MTELTDSQYWDDYWSAIALPAEVRREPGFLYRNAILDVFDRFLPVHSPGTVLEVGGAPGQYLVYLYRRLGYQPSCLDYSPLGCGIARENFRRLNIRADVYEGDIFDPPVGVRAADVVFSLGLIEHFDDLEGVVAAHSRLVRPGGILLLGAPNFLGLNGAFLRRLRPELLPTVHLRSMDLRNWAVFETNLKLTRLFRDYVGGVEPGVFLPPTPRPGASRVWQAAAVAAHSLLHSRFPSLRRFNHRLTSGYLIGVYRTPA